MLLIVKAIKVVLINLMFPMKLYVTCVYSWISNLEIS